jgi:hypothetical protein
MSNKKIKTINLPCQCAGGYRTCGYLRVCNVFKEEFEFCWIKKEKQKRAKIGVLLGGKDLKKLKSFLNKA